MKIRGHRGRKTIHRNSRLWEIRSRRVRPLRAYSAYPIYISIGLDASVFFLHDGFVRERALIALLETHFVDVILNNE